jgi:alkanesulfonate monooxygenase SsuD/methylene tetrahydromethanopterin reductase-like flavin-dependent oxidoreductase (luciferase family)
LQFGAALWGMQSTRRSMKHHADLYAELIDDCRLAEELGYHSLWLTEHRFWYDGYNPSLLATCAFMAAATSTLRVGTSCVLMPQHEPRRLAESAAVADLVSDGRLELGLANGYREHEFDGLGISRRHRASRMEESLDILLGAWADGPYEHHGKRFDVPSVDITPKPVQRPIPIWVAAVTEAPVVRAAKRGLDIILSDAHSPERAGELIELYRTTADEHGVDHSSVRFGILHYVWVDETTERARESYIPRLRALLLEQLGGWRYLSDEDGNPIGFERPDTLREIAEGVIANASIGDPDTVIANLRRLADHGVNFVIGRQNAITQTRQELHSSMRMLASEVMPALAERGS